MNTTALIVEILVVGFQAFSAILILLWLLIPQIITQLFQLLLSYKSYSALLTLIVTAVVYTIGIIMDRLAVYFANGIWPIIPKACRGWLEEKHRASLEEEDNYVRALHKEKVLSGLIANHQSRMRIARGTMFNVFLFGILITLALIFKHKYEPCVSIALYLLILFFAILIWGMHKVTFHVRINQVRKIEQE